MVFKSASNLMVAVVLGAGALPIAVSAQTCPAVPPASNFQSSSLFAAGYLNEPVGMSVAKDGRVFVVERAGRVSAYDPKSSNNPIVAADFTANTYWYTGAYDVGGLWTVALSPTFASDNWIYILWAPKSGFTGGENHQTGKVDYRLSRFKVSSASIIDVNSEQIIFTVKSRWNTHNGASLKFGKNSDLFLSLGDNNDAGCSDQYSPMDERTNNFWCDDQGTTANSMSMNGKVLRIHPVETMVNGKYYTIPDGNLFPVGTANTLPEIYTMGHRNPYRIFPDPVTDRLYIAMNGPAAGSKTARGPQGADIWEVTDGPANFGYPYFLKNLEAYCHWDYATTSCKAYQGLNSNYNDPNAPVNYSPNNTGIKILPKVKPAVLWESDGSQAADPVQGLGTCGPGTGPVYHYDQSLSTTPMVKFPPYFNDKWFIYAVGGGWQPKLVTMPPPPAAVTAITSSQVAAPPWGAAGTGFSSLIMDMEFGPGDGAMYVLDYGNNMYEDNANSTVRKITFNGCLPPPSALAKPQTDLSGAFSGVGGRLVSPPLGSRLVEVFDLSGKKVWEKDVNPANPGRIHLPGKESNVMWVRFK